MSTVYTVHPSQVGRWSNAGFIHAVENITQYFHSRLIWTECFVQPEVLDIYTSSSPPQTPNPGPFPVEVVLKSHVAQVSS